MRKLLSTMMLWIQTVVLIGSLATLMQKGMIFEFRSKVILMYLSVMLLPMLAALQLNVNSNRGIYEKNAFAKVSVILFAGTYLVLLFSLVFMNQLRVTVDMGIREYFYANANMIPFYTVRMMLGDFLEKGSLLALVNICGNLALLAPLGFLLPLGLPCMRRKAVFFLFVLALACGIEAAQLYLRVGRLDVDDILLNFLGAVISYAVYHLSFVRLWLRNRCLGARNEMRGIRAFA